jgi:hypothetical protein
LLNWRLIGPDGEKWPMMERTVLVPDWALSITEQDREARRGAAVAVAMDRHAPRPKAPRAQVAAYRLVDTVRARSPQQLRQLGCWPRSATPRRGCLPVVRLPGSSSQ